MITVTINSKEIKLEKPITVLDAARQEGIRIPTLCYHELLEPYGGCRLCLVEVEKMATLQTACTLLTVDGMVVKTESDKIAKARRGMLEFLLINHALDCPYCDKAGECDLQDNVEKYGPAKGRFKETKRKIPESLEDSIIVRNMERCILCTRCVRMCNNVQGAFALSLINRGGHSHIQPFSGGTFDCEYCGNCISVCPVGSLMSRLHRHAYRPWQIESETETICPYCGVGCTVIVQARSQNITRVIPKFGTGLNNGLLCARGRFGYEFVGSKDRLKTPLIRKGGMLEPSTWEEAISLIAKKLSEIRDQHGGKAIGGIASSRCTNEDNYVFQKFMRIAIGTNTIDSIARMGYSGAQRLIENIFGQGSTANLINGLANSDTILCLGGDPTTINPVLGLQIRESRRNGGNILTIGYLKGFENFSPISLKPRIYSENTLLEGLIVELVKRKGLTGEKSAFEARIKDIKTSLEDVEKECGLSKTGLDNFIEILVNASAPSVILGPGLIQRADGSYSILLISALSYIMNARIYLLSERPNEQGLLDMGCEPDMLPGYRPVTLANFRKRYEGAWKARIPDEKGLTLFEMIEAAKEGSLKAMYVMGENPVFNLPNSKKIVSALKNLGFLVVQDIFLTETAQIANVVLPSLGWAEKDGTYTNLERRIQRVRRALSKDGMEDWRIVAEISKNMGVPMDYSSAEDILTEISNVSPLYKDITHAEIEKGDALWPYKGEPLRGGLEEISLKDIICHAPRISDGKFFISIEKPLFLSGTLSRKALALNRIYPEAVVRINPLTAQRLGLNSGDIVSITTEVGTLTLPLLYDILVDESTVMLTNNFEERGAFSLIDYKLDQITKAPGIEGWEVKIQKIMEKVGS
ncbi:MAG: NADH-quinone oxidoreductase subunit NuoG [Nitrospirota bacterium]|nr:NADH-quinone oxidoreductase subunit NuoG [Nitrospirota bacterium]MDH5767442.1 NADH-quinone oxidoreductase subunit NuoG [Nitrospirota bacterium]